MNLFQHPNKVGKVSTQMNWTVMQAGISIGPGKLVILRNFVAFLQGFQKLRKSVLETVRISQDAKKNCKLHPLRLYSVTSS